MLRKIHSFTHMVVDFPQGVENCVENFFKSEKW